MHVSVFTLQIHKLNHDGLIFFKNDIRKFNFPTKNNIIIDDIYRNTTPVMKVVAITKSNLPKFSATCRQRFINFIALTMRHVYLPGAS